MIEKIDVNGDGCVDIDEFGELYQSLMDEKDEEEDMREAFNVFDQNGDGFITVDELRSVLASLGLKQGRTFEDCKRMIMKVDVDGDGMVDYREFKKMMKGGGFSAVVNHMLGSPLIFITGCKYFGHQETAGIITQDQLRQVFMLAIG
ncbi:calmodulin-like protein 3 [Populus alba x Populus x berolinensis]|nr:calmodulin-like protein 3 [Populus alba x Populus x berolinensis]